jgi:peptidyl-prolyl cis-trans isomerase C
LKTKVKKILEDLQDGANFSALAQQKSLCPSGRKGGDLGAFGRGQMVKPFEKAAFALQKGGLTTVKTEFSWHVIKRLK